MKSIENRELHTMNTDILQDLSGTQNLNARRKARRRVSSGELVEPVPMNFADAQEWKKLSKSAKTLAKIYAVARMHRDKPLTGVSAAAVLGSVVHERYHTHVHFAHDAHTSSSPRTRVPYTSHYIPNSRPKELIAQTMASASAPREILDDPLACVRAYTPLTDTLGLVNGLLVTTPLQTIFECLRSIVFEQAMIICDDLARAFGIARDELDTFMDGNIRRWRGRITRFKANFIDARAENGGESFARARMIRAGFVAPELQRVVPNPYAQLERAAGPSVQTSATVRPDFCWDVTDPASNVRHLAAELDGQGKYTDPKILAASGGTGEDVVFKEKDRESALCAVGYAFARFRFNEVRDDFGRIMIAKLEMLGVPKVDAREQARRRKWLAWDMRDATLKRFIL
ncbi:hypothetical protein [Alloscardovia macacae]|nr:hypothetical protein [Alloscardovia macacae]